MTPNNPSKPVPLEAEVVEAVAKALRSVRIGQRAMPPFVHYEEAAWTAILAADEARGMRVERLERPWHDPEYRLVSRWFPIKGPVDE